ncbi:hypothetical protein [Chitinophaga pinensis]|uniref:Uncharacterized protein n=1 Tax=Chitinophaga pinensis TaxID=79329 RepID=A0A5C6LXI5_9BACT|nr:hypothetical protein [Chitinophaga pinensis]TWW02145.1 hypothetical protein FEF09_03095 [Chitinophaga pinensis]
MRPFRLAEWIIALLGLICPIYLLGTYLFLTDQWALFARIPRIGLEVPVIGHYKVWGAMAISLFFFAVGWLLLQRTLKKMLIQGRKIWSVMAVYVFIAILIPFFNVHFSPAYWILAILPLSLFVANAYWSIVNNTVANIVHILTLAYVIVMQYFSRN